MRRLQIHPWLVLAPALACAVNARENETADGVTALPTTGETESASITVGSTSEFIFIQMRAGRPSRAWAISSAMCFRMRLRSVSGDMAIAISSAGSA